MKLIIEQMEVETGSVAPDHKLSYNDKVMLAYILCMYVLKGNGTSHPTTIETFANVFGCSELDAEKILMLHASTVRSTEAGFKLGDIVPGVELTVKALVQLNELARDYAKSMYLTTDTEIVTKVATICCIIPDMAKLFLKMNVPTRAAVPN